MCVFVGLHHPYAQYRTIPRELRQESDRKSGHEHALDALLAVVAMGQPRPVVLLTSDPVRAPRFVLVSQSKSAPGVLRVDLDVPKGLSRQYFDAAITRANGQAERKQLAEDGLSLPFAAAEAPTTIRLLLQMFEVASGPVRLDANSGYSARFRFEPNDIGKVAFQATPLKLVNGALLLDRHGRTIRFRRTGQ